MDIKTLIDKASKCSKQTQSELAKEMSKSPARLSDWKNGHWKPDAGEILFLAHKAGLPAIETVAEVLSQIDDKYATLWQQAVRERRQNTGQNQG